MISANENKTDGNLPVDYRVLFPTLKKGVIFIQLITSIFEFVVIKDFTNTFLNRFTTLHSELSVYLALIAVILIEIGLNRTTPFSIRIFIHKRWNSKLLIVLSGLTILFTFTLLSVSLFFSYNGGKLVAEQLQQPELQDSTKIENKFLTDKNFIEQQFVKDSLTYRKDQSEFKINQIQIFEQKIAQQESYKNWRQVEILSNQKQTFDLNFNNKVITGVDSLKIAKSKSIDLLILSKNKNLAELRSNNENLIENFKEKQSNQAKLLLYFSLFLHFLFFALITSMEVWKKLDNWELEKPFEFVEDDKSLFDFILKNLKLKINRFLWSKAEKFFGEHKHNQNITPTQVFEDNFFEEKIPPSEPDLDSFLFEIEKIIEPQQPFVETIYFEPELRAKPDLEQFEVIKQTEIPPKNFWEVEWVKVVKDDYEISHRQCNHCKQFFELTKERRFFCSKICREKSILRYLVKR